MDEEISVKCPHHEMEIQTYRAFIGDDNGISTSVVTLHECPECKAKMSEILTEQEWFAVYERYIANLQTEGGLNWLANSLGDEMRRRCPGKIEELRRAWKMRMEEIGREGKDGSHNRKA